MTKIYRIEMYGDSTTYGVGATNPTTESEPAVLAALFAGRYDPAVKQVLISNQGMSGTIAQQLLAGSDGVHLPFAQLMASSNANMVILNYGMNDSVPAAGVTLQYYGQVLGDLIDIARAAGKFVVLQQPNPSCTPEHAALGDYVRKLNSVAQAKGVAVVDQYLRSLELTQSINPTCWGLAHLPSGRHPPEHVALQLQGEQHVQCDIANRGRVLTNGSAMKAYLCCYCGAGDHTVAGCPWTRITWVKLARPLN